MSYDNEISYWKRSIFIFDKENEDMTLFFNGVLSDEDGVTDRIEDRMISENEYLSQNNMLINTLVSRYNNIVTKSENGNIKYFSKTQGQILLKYNTQKEEVFVNKLLENTVKEIKNINTNIKFSPELFHELSEYEENNERLIYMRNLFCHIILSSKASYNSDNGDFIFSYFGRNHKKEEKLQYSDNNTEDDFIWDIYCWLKNKDDENLGFLAKQVVVDYLANLLKIAYVNEGSKEKLYLHLDAVLNIIISDKSKEYFDIRKSLKNDANESFRKYHEFQSKSFSSFITVLLSTILAIFSLFISDLNNLKSWNDIYIKAQSVKEIIVFICGVFIVILVSQFIVYVYLEKKMIEFDKKLKRNYENELLLLKSIVDDFLPERTWKNIFCSLVAGMYYAVVIISIALIVVLFRC